MKRLLTQGELCELLRIKYSTLCRMLNAGDCVSPVNGRGRKLVFDPDAVEAWLKSRQSQMIPAVTSPIPTKQKQREKDRKRRLEQARAALEERHRVATKKGEK